MPLQIGHDANVTRRSLSAGGTGYAYYAKRPQDHIALDAAASRFHALANGARPVARETPAQDRSWAAEGAAPAPYDVPGDKGGDRRGLCTKGDGIRVQMHDGSIVIASITSCTNTSNPYVMIGAGLVARKARALGLTRKPWVKTSLAPGSQVVSAYLKAAGLQDDPDAIGFNLVG